MLKVDPEFIHRLFYPQVPLVMAAKVGRRVSAMPVVSYTSVSEKPPMVAVDCMKNGFTCVLAMRAKAFSLSVLDATAIEVVSKLAMTSGAQVRDKLLEAGLKHRRGRRLNVPVIEGAMATIECLLKSSIRFGDHVLLLGKVESAEASGAFKGFWDFNRYKPILYTGWQGGLSTYRSP